MIRLLSLSIAMGLLAGVLGGFHPARAQETPGIGEPTEQRYEARVTASGETFEVRVGGGLDLSHAFSWHEQGGGYAFETMGTLSFRNVGRKTARNPRLVLNDRGRWWSLEEVATEAVGDARTPEEKALRLWYHLSRHRFNRKFSVRHQGGYDPFLHFHSFGHGLCGHSVLSGLPYFEAAGLGGGLNEGGSELELVARYLHGHSLLEVPVGGELWALDLDKRFFALDRENLRPVSGDEIARDHDLARRELMSGPVHDDWRRTALATPVYGRDDELRPPPRWGLGAPVFLLRPGEEIVFPWAPAEKWIGKAPPLASTSRLTWTPLSAEAAPEELFESVSGFRREGAELVAEATARGILASAPPWAMAGGAVTFELDLPKRKSTASLELSLDGGPWQSLWTAGGKQKNLAVDVPLGPHLPRPTKRDPLRRALRLRLALEQAKGARVRNLILTTDLMTATRVLPALEVGDNRALYVDDTEAPVEVEVGLRWTEWSGSPPPAPAEPLTPVDGAVVASTFVPFAWPRTPGATAWHLTVSPTEDFHRPWRPNYDVILDEPAYEVPFRGMFSHGETYFWRVRARTAAGVWSEWSPTWSFSWQGPMVPRNLRWEEADGKIRIAWDPNPRGLPPVRYRIFGSDERGFSVGGSAEVLKAGETAETELLVVDGEETDPGFNRAFYRVVAIDAAGTESVPSAALELPRPFLFRRPPLTAQVGRPYLAQLSTLVSQGDLQRRPPAERGERVRTEYFQREVPSYELVQGPSWLDLDRRSGWLSGAPSPMDAGPARIKVRVRLLRPFEVSPTDFQAKLFPALPVKSAEWTFEIEVADPEPVP